MLSLFVTGNEEADELARRATVMDLVGTEPTVGLPAPVCQEEAERLGSPETQ